MPRQVEETCYFCKFAKSCGWHLLYCTIQDETVSEDSSCNQWEEQQ